MKESVETSLALYWVPHLDLTTTRLPTMACINDPGVEDIPYTVLSQQPDARHGGQRWTSLGHDMMVLC
jgi:hypothetical protein